MVIAQRLTKKLPTRRATITAWVLALLVFGCVVAVMVHFSELKKVGHLVRSLDLRWMLVAATIQAATYFCAGGVWHVALAREHRRVGLRQLGRLAVVMLFTNQAFPTAGVSGSAVVTEILQRQHVPGNVAMGALVVGLMTTYMAYAIAVPISLVLLRVYHALSVRLLVLTAVCTAIAIGAPAAIVWFRRSIPPPVRERLKRVPGVGKLLDTLGGAPTGLLHDPVVLRRALALQLVELTLDATTLQIMLIALGVHASATAVFGSYIVAAAASQVVPVPMGLGSFEAVLVAMLCIVGIALEPAMTATLLFRVFTFWLPMLPGLVLARAELLDVTRSK